MTFVQAKRFMNVKKQEGNIFLPQIKKDFSPYNSSVTLPPGPSVRIILSLLCIQSQPIEWIYRACDSKKIWERIRVTFSPSVSQRAHCLPSPWVGMRGFICILSKYCLSYMNIAFYSLCSTFTTYIWASQYCEIVVAKF